MKSRFPLCVAGDCRCGACGTHGRGEATTDVIRFGFGRRPRPEREPQREDVQ